MHATIRRYDGVDQNRTVELTNKVNERSPPDSSDGSDATRTRYAVCSSPRPDATGIQLNTGRAL